MALLPHSSLLLLVAVLVVPGIYASDKKDDPRDILPRYPLHPKRSPVNPWLRTAEAQEESHLPGMISWMEQPTGMEEFRPYVLVEENSNLYNPTMNGRLDLVGPFGNPYSQDRFVVDQNGQPREENLFHSLRPLQNPYEQDKFIIHSLEIPRQRENPYDLGGIMVDHLGQTEQRKMIMNPLTLKRPGYFRYPETVEVNKNDKGIGSPQPASYNKPIRSRPERWNEFVINSIIKFKYGGDDLFDMSEFSWIPGRDSLSPSMIEDMLRWDQPDGIEILVPKLLKVIDTSAARFAGQGKWEFPDAFKDNALQIYTVPLSIVRLFREILKPSPVQIEPIRKTIDEDVRFDLKKPQDNHGGDGVGLHPTNRHAVDFRDYHDYEITPNKELPQKDPVLLGQVNA